jgi:hypothetical protein
MRTKEEKTSRERKEMHLDNQKLKDDLEVSRGRECALRMRLEELERRKNRFSQNWKKAIHNVVSKKNADGHWSSQ